MKYRAESWSVPFPNPEHTAENGVRLKISTQVERSWAGREIVFERATAAIGSAVMVHWTVALQPQ